MISKCASDTIVCNVKGMAQPKAELVVRTTLRRMVATIPQTSW
jgi:hypothetical protein